MLVDRVLEEEFSRYGLKIPQAIQKRLNIYIRELQHWNRRVNLTSLEGVQLIRRLIVEPIWIGRELQMSGNLADIGSGNGSPGIPIYLACGLKTVRLVEARTKRAAFLRHIAGQLNGDGIIVHKSRVEDIQEPFKTVEWVTLQAVNPGSVIASLRRLFNSTTHVVWLTARREALMRAASRICVPGSESEAWVFELDQF